MVKNTPLLQMFNIHAILVHVHQCSGRLKVIESFLKEAMFNVNLHCIEIGTYR